MAKKDIDWSNLGFGYVKTDKRFVANYKNGAWDNGVITDDDKVVISECAGVLQYSQSCFEGMKAYTTENGHTVIFRPDMNASRMADSCRRLEMPVFPEDKFVEAIAETVRANEDWVPPYGSGASLMNISSEYLQHLLDHTSREVLSHLQSRFQILIEQHHTEQVISRLVLTMQ